MEPGEEFAPSAEVEKASPKSSRKVSQAKKGKSRGFGDNVSDLQLFFWCLFIILSGFYLLFWRQEKFIVGFCGVPQTERSSFLWNESNGSINGGSSQRTLSQ
jgi:hypothetical protein